MWTSWMRIRGGACRHEVLLIDEAVYLDVDVLMNEAGHVDTDGFM